MENNRPLGWTTLEEAKLLVDAGLDPNTADMRYEENNYGLLDEWVAYPFGGDIKNFDVLKKEFPDSEFYPCWSLGALIELMPKFVQEKEIEFSVNLFVSAKGGTHIEYSSFEPEEVLLEIYMNNLVEAVISMIRKLIENGYIKKHE